MKIKRYTAAALCAAIMLSCMPAVAETLTKTSLEIHENTVLNEIDRKMFGVSSDWITDTLKQTFYGSGNDMEKTKDDINRFFGESGYKLPIFRIGGGSANEFKWKQYLTSYGSNVKSFGIPELLSAVMSVDPDVKFSVTLNIASDTDDNILDLIRFLTLNPEDAEAVGSDNVNWALERVKRGIKKPLPIENVVLGNELDWLGGLDDPDGKNWSADKYISECSRIIPKIRKVNPNVPIGVFSKTATSGFDDSGRAWDEAVIKALGPKVEYIVQHLYYHLKDAAVYEQTGKDYDNIESFISEEYNTAHCKVYLEEHGMFADWGDSEQYPRIMSFEGMMAMSMFYCRRLRDSHFKSATFHGFSGENPVDDNTLTLCSEVLQAYKSTPYMLTGAGEMLKFFYENAGQFAVSSELKSTETVFFKDDVYNTWLSKKYYAQQTPNASYATRYPSINALVTTAENGGLNIIIANREEDITHENISISYDNGPYRLREKTVIRAEDYSANITAQNPEAVSFTTTKYTDNAAFTSYTANPMEIVLLKLEPINLNKTVNSVEIENTVTKGYKKTVNSPYNSLAAVCNTTAADDAPITFKVLKKGAMPETAEKNENYTETEITVSAKQAREGIILRLPDTMEKGRYTLAAGNFENSSYDYAYAAFNFDNEAAENSSVISVSAISAEGGKADVKVEINPENKLSEYTYLIYKGEPISVGGIENLINMGQIKRKGNFLKFTADMPKSWDENGTYTVFVGNGEENVGKCVFEYSYEPEKVKEIYVTFNQTEPSKIIADIGFSDGIPSKEIFTVMLVKPGYNLVSTEDDLKNIVYADTIENKKGALSLEIKLKDNHSNGMYKLMINGSTMNRVYTVNVNDGTDVFIEGNVTNEKGELITQENISTSKKVNADIYSNSQRNVSALCAVYSKEGRLLKSFVKNNFALNEGMTQTEFDLDGKVENAGILKIFIWDDTLSVKPLAKYYRAG